MPTMIHSPSVVREDLDLIRKDLAPVFDRMGGSRLLITGGAGFLGYYLVQAVTHWNRYGERRR